MFIYQTEIITLCYTCPSILSKQHIPMCFHKRFHYSCSHFGWGAQIRVCQTQKAFDDNTHAISCDAMWSHPLHARKIQTVCQECSLQISKVKFKLDSAKLLMKSIEDSLQRKKNERLRRRRSELIRDEMRDCGCGQPACKVWMYLDAAQEMRTAECLAYCEGWCKSYAGPAPWTFD